MNISTDRALIAARARTSLLAGALGNAWGGPYEGREGFVAPPFPHEPRFSDDTLLTVATCEAIVLAGGVVNPADVARTFRAWFDAGRLKGIGSSTLKALRDLSAGGHWALSGARGEFAAGSGAAMRVAPLGFLLDPASDDDRVLIRDVARITHHSDEAYAGALAVVTAIWYCSRSSQLPDDLIDVVVAKLPDTRVRDRIAMFGTFSGDPRAAAARWGNSG